MIDTGLSAEKFLQNLRFNKIKSYLNGDVLDFGGNEGELKKFVSGNYLAINYDHTAMNDKQFDTIVCLAVIEHIAYADIYSVFKKFKTLLKKQGKIILTTPTKMADPALKLLTLFGLLDKKNIAEHKHYWTKKELFNLAEKSGFIVKKYRKFQLGFNQMAIFE